MRQFHYATDTQELLYTPETGRLRIQFLKGGGISIIIPEAQRKPLSKALWYSAQEQ